MTAAAVAAGGGRSARSGLVGHRVKRLHGTASGAGEAVLAAPAYYPQSSAPCAAPAVNISATARAAIANQERGSSMFNMAAALSRLT